MEKILISACLIGDKTTYNGKDNKTPLLNRLLEKYELIPFCPEVEGGLSIPRIPSERIKDRVINNKGHDVTRNYQRGAELAYQICNYLGIKIAILKENSPSCGVHQIYDGTFKHKLINGQGYTSEYLRKKGLRVISENDIEDLLNNQ